MQGPGKYDDWCSFVRFGTKAKGAMVLIFEGEHGNGFSSQLPPEQTAQIPDVLRQIADQIEADLKNTVDRSKAQE